MRTVGLALGVVVFFGGCTVIEAGLQGNLYDECFCTTWEDRRLPASGSAAAGGANASVLTKRVCTAWTCETWQACFPRGALLRQGDAGDSVKMHSLTIGSKIVGANGTNPAGLFVGHSARSQLPFSPTGQMDTVTNFIHRDENIKSTFLRLHTPKGALELSPNHLLFARNGSSTQSVLARDVRIGTTLLHRDGEAMVIDPYYTRVLCPCGRCPAGGVRQVTSIDAFTDHGAYAPMTWSGELEVNGFAVSAYAQYPR